MLITLVENLEIELQKTEDIKSKLNAVCEVSWKLLCPPGTGNTGKFIVDKPKKSKDHLEGSSSSNDLLSNVTDLINYGKLVRSHGGNPNPRTLVKPVNITESFIKVKDVEKTSLKNKDSKLKTGRSLSLDLKSPSCLSVNRGRIEKVGDGSDVVTVTRRHQSTKVNVEVHSSTSTLITHSHTCSLKLSDKIHQVKISEDLNNLLKLFNSYVGLNSHSQKSQPIPKQIDFEQIFSKRFLKNVKLRLKRDLQNTNQCETYLRYLDLYEKSGENKNKNHAPSLVVYFGSKKQLKLLETKANKLLELELKSQMLKVILDCMSRSDTDKALE